MAGGPFRVVVIGAGAGGLSAAIALAAAGADVTVLERADQLGGKLRTVDVGGAAIDAGPTVFTMRWVLDALFAQAGACLDQHLTLQPLQILARHAWDMPAGDGGRLDLHADPARSADAIGAFAGAAAARGYSDFVARARNVYSALEAPFIRAERPNAFSLMSAAGPRGLATLAGAASPFATLWRALARDFADPRLRQLFARYATYTGASPFAAPAILMLIAHVEQQGVWSVEGGMRQVALALATLVQSLGATVRCGANVASIEVRRATATGVVLSTGERLPADAVVAAGDAAAFAAGLFGAAVTAAAPPVQVAQRSLSAVTWAMRARASGFPLHRHTVFFGPAYEAEFDAIFGHAALPEQPTVYVCAQDRDDAPDSVADGATERLLVLVNAPAIGADLAQTSVDACEARAFALMRRCGLTLERTPSDTVRSTPADFADKYPATGGALYGRALHGPMTAFRRPGSRSRIARLYLAGGSVHPGPGVPMAVLSGQRAASSVLADRAR